MTETPSPSRDVGSVALVVALAASTATACFVAAADGAWHAAVAEPLALASFVALTLILQSLAVEVYGKGATSVAGIGLLAVGFRFGIGAAMATALLAAIVLALRHRIVLHRAVYNAATFSLAAAAATGAFEVVGGISDQTLWQLVASFVAAVLLWALNIGLITVAMSLAESRSALEIWRERFRWMTPHNLAFGPLALASTIAYDRVGVAGLIAFVLPPALLILSTRLYLERTRNSVEELRTANDDLRALFRFASGLAARAHDADTLLAYVERELSLLVGCRVEVVRGPLDTGIPLLAGGTRIASLVLDAGDDFDAERWSRLQDAILPQLATAIESAELVERVRKTHLDTIAALSRSMEAKDYYTGGHTERVSDIALALATRLGFAGADLDAVEIGALLHDIGKIGIPERILHKPGPLDEDEWKVMREHPVISDYILSEVDLHPIVRQIARSSHERIDGQGYPDALEGESIPLAARIVLVADAFDALTSDRPYRRGRDTRTALEELRANAGTQFCPQVLAALEELYREQPDVLGAATLRVA